MHTTTQGSWLCFEGLYLHCTNHKLAVSFLPTWNITIHILHWLLSAECVFCCWCVCLKRFLYLQVRTTLLCTLQRVTCHLQSFGDYLRILNKVMCLVKWLAITTFFISNCKHFKMRDTVCCCLLVGAWYNFHVLQWVNWTCLPAIWNLICQTGSLLK